MWNWKVWPGCLQEHHVEAGVDASVVVHTAVTATDIIGDSSKDALLALRISWSDQCNYFTHDIAAVCILKML